MTIGPVPIVAIALIIAGGLTSSLASRFIDWIDTAKGESK